MDDWGNIDYWQPDREKLKEAENKKANILYHDQKMYIKFIDRQYERIQHLNNLIRLPKKGELLRLVTQKSFNAFALFLFIKEREEVEEVFLTTYSIDKHTISGIEEIVKNNPNMKITLLIASLIKHDRPELRGKMKELAINNENVRFVEAYNHTKIIAVKTKDNYYAIEGSGNLSDNARIESYLFDNNKESFDFHKNWINDIINKRYEGKLQSNKDETII